MQIPACLFWFISLFVQLIFHIIFYYFANYTLFILVKNLYSPTVESFIKTSLIGLWVLFIHFNTIFNHYMAVNIDPGRSTDISQKLLGKQLDYCIKCKYPIPEKAFHCGICNKCTLDLDHHCPWISCIGRQNRRYFVNFVTYVCFYIATILILMLFLDNQYSKNDDIMLFKVLFGLFLIILTVFDVFHWLLVINGKSSVSLCKNSNFNQKLHWRDNLNKVFGTQNIFKCLLPSTRPLNHYSINNNSEEQEKIQLVSQ